MKIGSSQSSPPARLPKPNEHCWCGSGKKYKRCHYLADQASAASNQPKLVSRAVQPGVISPKRLVPDNIPRPSYASSGVPDNRPIDENMQGERLDRMRRACKGAAQVLRLIGSAVRPGITTDELDAMAHEEYIRLGGYPSTLNYHGFPKSICTSVNEVICHGIPDSRPLDDGDIVNLDVTLFLEGMHGDCSATFAVGNIDEISRTLVRVTHECMMLGIEAIKPGRPISDIGRAIETHADRHKFGVVRAYCGHGIGEKFHTSIQVPHHFDPHSTQRMLPGMVFTVEPMITIGSYEHRVWNDGWTAVTEDGQRTAQFEHTILVTDTGAEILTLP